MNKTLNRILVALVIFSLCAVPLGGLGGSVAAQGRGQPPAVATLSADGKHLYNGLPRLVVVADPKMAGKKFSEPNVTPPGGGPAKVQSQWYIYYLPAGATDPWGAVCQTFPSAAQTAVNAAANIWANLLLSNQTIYVEMCWSNIGSSSILGYSGGEPLDMNFSGAPKANTWYTAALADSLSGVDQDPAYFDDYITFNTQFSWYTGSGTPPSGQYDMESVALHEMGHGVNIAGCAGYSGGTGGYGCNSTTYPNIYDTFMEDAGGTSMMNTSTYPNPGTALGTLLTSNSLWFDGPASKIAGGGSRVKIYAPSTWAGGSSYSHLDYSTYVSTPDNLMVYAISSATTRRSVGPITRGMLRDMGWGVLTLQGPSGIVETPTPTFKWNKVYQATQYYFSVYTGGGAFVESYYVPRSACGSQLCLYTPSNPLPVNTYKWYAWANIAGGWVGQGWGSAFEVSLPFDSEFNGSHPGWAPVSGTWTQSSTYYYTGGTSGLFVSAKHTSNYNNYTYTALLDRVGCTGCANAIYVNGTPLPLSGGMGNWYGGFKFEYANSQYWSLWWESNGSEINLEPWTYAPSIVMSSGWQTLAVTYNSGTHMMQFFVNDILVSVWYMFANTSGNVGITMYSDGTSGDTLYADWAVLTADAPSMIVAESPNITPKDLRTFVPVAGGDSKMAPAK